MIQLSEKNYKLAMAGVIILMGIVSIGYVLEGNSKAAQDMLFTAAIGISGWITIPKSTKNK